MPSKPSHRWAPRTARHGGKLSCLCLAVICCLGALVLPFARANDAAEAWQASIGRDHPLAGRIWDVAAGAFIERQTLIDRLAGGRFVLLGERHDNPDHHRLQTWILQALIAAGRRPAVGFEMFTADDAPAIARHLAASPTDAGGVARAVDWQRSGWPDWAMYEPIVAAALQAGLPIIAANASPATVRALGQHGPAALPADLAARLGIDRPAAAEAQAAMAEDIREVHCGYASGPRVDAMILVQRLRDAQMAESLTRAGQPDGGVLIAGAGHVRRDYGVPTYLAGHESGSEVISVAFLEVDQHVFEAAAYATRFRRRTLPFDYVWFTPRADDQDPCTAFREQLQRLQKPQED